MPDKCPEELDRDRDSVRARVESILSRIDNAVGEKNTDRNAELIAGDEGTANGFWGNFRHVQDNDS